MLFRGFLGVLAIVTALLAYYNRTRPNAPPLLQIALVTMVRNESHILAHMLDSAREHVDSVVVCDTDPQCDAGGTLRAARAWRSSLTKQSGIPVVYTTTDCPFIDFSTTRNCCLQAARTLVPPETHFFLTLDADHEVHASPRWRSLLTLNRVHHVAVQSQSIFFALPYLIPTSVLIATRDTCAYEGVTHEIFTCKGAVVQIPRQLLYIVHHSNGGNRQDKFTRDARLLYKALSQPNVSHALRVRYSFYLARTHDAMGQYEQANALYLRYLEQYPMDDVQQTFVVRLRVAELWQRYTNATRLFAEAAEVDPRRAEPWVHLARQARLDKVYQIAALYMQQAKTRGSPPHTDALFVDARYYYAHEFGWVAREEDALVLYYTGQRDEARAAWKRLLTMEKLPADVRIRVENNIKRY